MALIFDNAELSRLDGICELGASGVRLNHRQPEFDAWVWSLGKREGEHMTEHKEAPSN